MKCPPTHALCASNTVYTKTTDTYILKKDEHIQTYTSIHRARQAPKFTVVAYLNAPDAHKIRIKIAKIIIRMMIMFLYPKHRIFQLNFLLL